MSPGVATAQTGEQASDDDGWFRPDSTRAEGRADGLEGEVPAPRDVADADPRALSEFRPTLDKYGDWVEDARYGLVWVPARRWVGDDFAPYLTRGHWALDTRGDWVWQSDYPFGGIVFHYGRWAWVVGLGWAWVPGYRYAPAWVSWRVPSHGGLYVGWAPIPPSYVWVGGAAVGVGFYVVTPWVFCPSHYVFSRHVHSHRVHDPSRMKEAARQTKPYHPQVGARGPSPNAAGVPKSRVPATRVPAAPKPAGAVDTLRLPSRAPASALADQRRSSGGPALVDVPRRVPKLSASERVGAGTVAPRPQPLPRSSSVAPGPRPPQSTSPVPRASREPAWLPAARTSKGARNGQPVPQQGRVVLPRPTTPPQSVAPPRAPAKPAPSSRSPRSPR